MTDRIWLKHYPEGVPADINPAQYTSLVALMEESFQKYGPQLAYSFMGKNISYAQTDSLSRALAPTCRAWAWPRGTAWPSCCPTCPSIRWRWRPSCGLATWWST